ncbi:inactive protein RESTRICTED TEV MOVEMENT 2 [Euphorbia lathyris]|uniref:inactive protein RESTRICTED TEV MOVEMENT 2 n=1 Tax=Euphorbia lathyris TaxID=212925 RepID=UPI00331382A1
MATATATRTIAIQYEDFNPNFEWKEEQASNSLLLHLPEFEKEQMKITYVHSSRVIRVTGEHLISNNKWKRFNRAFPVPENCNVQKIQAKFQTPTLTITLPKISPTPTSTPTNPSFIEKPQNNKTDSVDSKKQEKPQNKQTDDDRKKQELNPVLPPSRDEKDEKKKKQEEEDNSSKKRKELVPTPGPSDEDEMSKKRKQETIRRSENYGEKAKEVKKKIMEFGREISEDKQSLVNIGVAILVIAALGAYIYSSSATNANSND